MKQFPGYLVGDMIFSDAWGAEMCRAEEIYFLFQFDGKFGNREITGEVTKGGKIMTFRLDIPKYSMSYFGTIGPDPLCDLKIPVFEVDKGAIFFLKNFCFDFSAGPMEINTFVAQMREAL